jgi:asparagine synthase (glutamine-hydrolysing)
MCGIAALLGRHKPEAAAAMIRAMNDSQAHRGPDDQGGIVLQVGDSVVGLGNRRLAILDLSPHGHQPMHNPDTGDVLVYNGETYNSPELRRELQQAGFTFRGRSDTEVLLRAYQHWGVDCLRRLRGMFAFALWDARRSRLLIARDHLGIKPLYCAACPGEWFVCASEVRALMSSGLVPAKVSRRALAGYLAYGAVQEPLTLFEGVFTLPRGSWMEFDSLGHVTAKGTYWQFPPPGDQRQRRLEAVAEEGRALFEQAVRRHMLSDVRVGIFLSSGLDSTAILGIARQFHSATEHLHAFNVSFSDDPEYDEAAMARVTAARFGVQYHEYPVEESTALGWIRDALGAMDQPSMDGFNTYMVARAVHEQGIIVALSGMGGDELFAGYNSFRRVPRLYRALSWMASLPPSWRAALARSLALPMNSVVRSKAAEIAAAGSDFLAIYFQTRRLLSDQSLTRLGLEPAELHLSPSYQVPELSCDGWVASSDPVASVARLESAFYLENVLLRDSDVFGMANSLEIRVPLLDLDLVDWALRLPSEVLLPTGAPSKHVLRAMCASFYTRAQLEQGKRGFMPPIGLWLRGPLRETMEESLRSLENSGLIDPAGTAPITQTFLREPTSPAWSRVWAMVTLGHWFEQHQSVPVGVQ